MVETIGEKENGRVCAVVVTYNRKNLLQKCLLALQDQSRQPDCILIMDNASTDGTGIMIEENFTVARGKFEHINLGANLGGGGGFHHGTRKAYEDGFDWIWLMDDDCLATKTCLEILLAGVGSRKDIYSPIVLSLDDKKSVLWGIKASVNSGNHDVHTLPFNGFLVHRQTLEKIGFPDRRFYIYGDDTEYNQRAKVHGKRIVMITDSVIYHPNRNNTQGLKICEMFLNKLWVYYKIRNAIIIYRRYNYYSINQIIMFTAAFIFYLLTLKKKYLSLWMKGFKDGINGKLYVNESLF